MRIEEVEHEFSTIPHMKEDTTEFLLNVKELRLRALAERPAKLYLEAQGEGPVTAAQIQTTADYEIVNPDLHLATLDAPDARLTVELNVEPGRGYAPAGQGDGLPIGVIPVDAIFSPVRRVNFHVTHTRVGQMTNYDKLTLEVWTDGTMSGVDAVSKSADILVDEMRMFALLGKPLPPTVERGLAAWHIAAAGQVQHADRGSEPLGARVQLPEAQRADDGRTGAREERGRAAGAAQLRPQVVRRAAREAHRARPAAAAGRGHGR